MNLRGQHFVWSWIKNLVYTQTKFFYNTLICPNSERGDNAKKKVEKIKFLQ